MADKDNDREELRKQFARYLVVPDFARELKPPRPVSRATRGSTKKAAAARPEEPAGRAIIELNPDYPGGIPEAKSAVLARLQNISDRVQPPDTSRHFLFATLTLGEIADLTTDTGAEPSPIYKVWRDEPLKPFLDRSVRTVKADACLTAFGADGKGIVVAVMDSGIDETHRHFVRYQNLSLPLGLAHRDFTGGNAPTVDRFGHGSHVAGIIAGRTSTDEGGMARVFEERGTDDTVRTIVRVMASGSVLRGIAPQATLLSLKVLDDAGKGYASALITALEHVEELNDFGRRIKVHCVNLSLGYPFDARWYAAGQSPLCTVVNRLSRSGVIVVAAAGNDGSTMIQPDGEDMLKRVGLDQSINDPGNAEEAITVGATHGEAPHRYGVSFFSSRGPTADGRVKPDLVAPGERILSCAAIGASHTTEALDEAGITPDPTIAYFREESGTSMAAPHVAGAVAALLSVRGEFIGRAEAVKAIFVSSATDLKRKADFQGSGLLDLLRAMQSI